MYELTNSNPKQQSYLEPSILALVIVVAPLTKFRLERYGGVFDIVAFGLRQEFIGNRFQGGDTGFADPGIRAHTPGKPPDNRLQPLNGNVECIGRAVHVFNRTVDDHLQGVGYDGGLRPDVELSGGQLSVVVNRCHRSIGILIAEFVVFLLADNSDGTVVRVLVPDKRFNYPQRTVDLGSVEVDVIIDSTGIA